MKSAYLEITPLPYQRDIRHRAAALADLPGVALLDSRGDASDGSRGWDFLSALPERLLSIDDFAYDVHAWLTAIEGALADGYSPTPDSLPFATGAVGFIDYDSGARLHGIQRAGPAPSCVGLYTACLVQSHEQQRAWFLAERRGDPHTQRLLLDRLRSADARAGEAEEPLARTPVSLRTPFRPDISPTRYREAIGQIREYLLAGDCYQINFAQRFRASLAGHASTRTWDLYQQLRAALPGRYSALLRLRPEHVVLSLSPERFLSVRDGHVVTQPIKGTAPRSTDPATDHRLAEALLHSPKDRAENVMITDLLRNDLGRYCLPGTVHTPTLCALRSYRNVHHLVSTVTGQLRPDVSAAMLLLGCTPGGSITGAPKRRAVEIIAELEPFPRGAYCGSVFTLSASGALQSNIAIRTLELVGSELYCWGGGGITVESDPAAEYQETLDKVGSLMAALAVGDDDSVDR